METAIYNQKGKETGKIKLPEEIFALPWNDDLVHQAVVSIAANSRKPVAHSKNRGEVRGGGKKPWRQKGTGYARHGSIRSPLWRGGGATFGPRNDKDYSQKVNKKMMIKALYVALSKKMKDGEVMFLDKFNFDMPKAKEGKNSLLSLQKIPGFGGILKSKNAAVIALGAGEANAVKSLRNFGNLSVLPVRNLNPVNVLSHRYLIITGPEESVEFLKNKTAKFADAQAKGKSIKKPRTKARK